MRQCPHDGSPTFYVAGHLEHQGPVALGERVGSYIVHAPIGRGGHATVYRAERALGLGDVALKVLHIDRADPQGVSRFYREALIGAQLSHPNTVRVLDVGQADSGAIFLAMELLHGQTWEARLLDLEAEGGTMQPKEAAAIAAEVLRGLAEAHDQGVIHRDLKPSNVMLAEAGGETFVKIMDFGVAHVLLSGLTEDGRAVGTPAYMSPEQCSGGKLDGRGDLYAVGVALYRALTGRLPFSESSTLGMMYAHANLPPTDIATVANQPLPPGLAPVVMQALAKAPEDRFVDARAMRQALEAVLNGRPLDEQRPVPSPSPARMDVDGDGTPATSKVAARPSIAQSRRLPWRYRVVATVAALGAVASVLLAFTVRTGGDPAPTPTPKRLAAVSPPVVAKSAARLPEVAVAPMAVVTAPVEPATPLGAVKPAVGTIHARTPSATRRPRSHTPTAPVLPP